MNDCIICLCTVEIDEIEADLASPLTQDIPCKCIYSVHEICLSKWLKRKFSCPMCGTVPIGISSSLDTQDSSDNPREQLLNHNQISSTRPRTGGACATCISTMFLILFIVMLIKAIPT